MAKKAVSLSFSSMDQGASQPTTYTPRNLIQRVPVSNIPAPKAGKEVLSGHQTAIIEAVRRLALKTTNRVENILVNAVAGSGKTFILLRACAAIPKEQSIAVMAYNKAIATEILDKVAALGLTNVIVKTCHAFGLQTIRAIHRNTRLDDSPKKRRMLENIQAPEALRDAIRKLVSMAKQSAVGVLWSVDDMDRWRAMIERFDILVDVRGDGGFKSEAELIEALVSYTINGLAYSQETAHYQIDFDDMLWIPLVEDMQPVTYDWVIGDEVQDFNASRRLMAKKMMRRNGRALFAGDRNQAIYAFSGADSESVDILLQEFDAEEMPLTTTYRCSRASVELAQQFVPAIQAGKDNKEGSVTSMTMETFELMVQDRKIGGGDAILCRLTKPLVKLCLKLIAGGVPAFVEGRDIGKSLEALTKKWDVESTAALVRCLESHRIAETRRLVEQGNEYAVESVNDKIDALLAIMSGCDTVADVRAKIARLFDDTNDVKGKDSRVLLSTVHKAKGREWDRVFILGWGKYMPSKRARLDWQKQAEANLQYVAVTRTKDALVLLSEEN